MATIRWRCIKSSRENGDNGRGTCTDDAKVELGQDPGVFIEGLGSFAVFESDAYLNMVTL